MNYSYYKKFLELIMHRHFIFSSAFCHTSIASLNDLCAMFFFPHFNVFFCFQFSSSLKLFVMKKAFFGVPQMHDSVCIFIPTAGKYVNFIIAHFYL